MLTLYANFEFLIADEPCSRMYDVCIRRTAATTQDTKADALMFNKFVKLTNMQTQFHPPDLSRNISFSSSLSLSALHTYPITSIPPRSLTLPNNLHHLSSPKSIIPSHRIRNLNPRQLRLLQPIPDK
jgi:hypothetical protein